MQLSAIAAAGATEVAAGSAHGGCALWVSEDGGSTWHRGAVTPAGDVRRGGGQLAWVAHGASGWLAVGDATAGAAAPGNARCARLAGRPDVDGRGRRGPRSPGAGRIVTAAVAAGGAGYVIVGHASVGARTVAAAWYAPGLHGLAPRDRRPGRARSTARGTG